MGFEPTVPLPARLFSRQVPSTTRPPLQRSDLLKYTMKLIHGCPYCLISYNTFMRTTQRKGDIAASKAIARFTLLGYDVAIPFTESAAYDLIVDTGVKMMRVQVRYTSVRQVSLRRIHSNSKGYVVKKTHDNAYDWLYIYKSTGEEYLIERCLSNRNSIVPTSEYLLN